MDESPKSQIRERMQVKDTDELYRIWKQHDQIEWREEAIEVVREILMERLQGPPPEGTEGSASAGTADGHEADTLYNSDRLIKVASWLPVLSWLFLIQAGVSFVYVVYGVLIFFGDAPYDEDVYSMLASVATPARSTLVSLFYFVLLRGIA